MREPARPNKWAGEAPRDVGRPEPGCFAIRLTKGGVEVAARIRHEPTPDPDFPDNVMDRSRWWHGDIDGADDPRPSIEPGERVWRIWHGGRRISDADYRFMVATAAWARTHAPTMPEARPRERIDLRQLPIPFAR